MVNDVPYERALSCPPLTDDEDDAVRFDGLGVEALDVETSHIT